MKHRKAPSQWPRTVKLSALAIAAGVMVGAGGTTLALWNTGLDFSAQAHSGYEYFAAGTPGDTKPAVDGKISVPIGDDAAATLKEERAVAIVFETESVSQGNVGLRYEIDEPDWGDHLFGAANTQFYRVGSAGECTVGKTPRADSHLTSRPVSAEYSGSEEPVVEYWCLVATIDEFPDEGKYADSVKVTAQDPADVKVEASDEWNAKITSVLDPANEPEHRITFTYDTFRPSADDS